MKNKLQYRLNKYKETVGTAYEGSRYPNPKATPPTVLHFVANIKVAEATIRRNEIVEEIKNSGTLGDVNTDPLKPELNNLDDEIALWRPYV